MAIFNQQSSAKKDVPSFANNDAAPNPQAAQTPTPTPIRETPAAADFNPTQAAPPRAVAEAPAKESLIAADLTIEGRSEEHTSELQSLMRISYAVFCLKKTKDKTHNNRKRSQRLLRKGTQNKRDPITT